MADTEREALFETVEDGLAARMLARRGSDVLAVVFSQVRVPQGHFGLSRLFGKTSHAVLLLNQPSNDWYRGADRAIDSAISRALEISKARRVVFYGSSMGAFGAVASASRWPAAEAVVFGPDWIIGERGSRSAMAGLGSSPGDPHLADLLAVPRQGRIDLVFGMLDPYDGGVAARLNGSHLRDRIRLVPLLSTHEVHDHLYVQNIIRRVISTFTRDIKAEAASKGLVLAAPDWQQALMLGEMAANDPARRDTEKLLVIAGQGHPGAAWLAEEAFLARGQPAAAEAVLAELAEFFKSNEMLDSLPMRYRKQVPRERLRLLALLGQVERLAEIGLQAHRDFPNDPDFRPHAPVN